MSLKLKIISIKRIYIEGPSQKEGPGVLATVLPLADKGLIFGDNSPFWEHGGIVCFHGLKLKETDMTWDRKARGGMLNIPHYFPPGGGGWSQHCVQPHGTEF